MLLGAMKLIESVVRDDQREPTRADVREPNEKAASDGKGQSSAAGGNELNEGVVSDDGCDPMEYY